MWVQLLVLLLSVGECLICCGPPSLGSFDNSFRSFFSGGGLSQLELEVQISQQGIRGSVLFSFSVSDEGNVTGLAVTVDLPTLMEATPASYTWALHELPVEYTQKLVCDRGYLGEK